MRRPACLAAVALLAAGCGADRLATPDVSRPYATGTLAEREFPQAGVKLQAPAEWPFDPGEGALVATTSSGSATVALWRYPRAEPLPDDPDVLRDAEQRLQEAVRTRDPAFQLEESRRLEVDGAEAIQLVGTQRFGDRERRVRSTHVYAKGAEYVLDTYAAPDDFPAVDEAVFQPLAETMKIDPPRP